MDDFIEKLKRYKKSEYYFDLKRPFSVFAKVDDVVFVKNNSPDEELIWKTKNPEIAMKTLPLLTESRLSMNLWQQKKNFGKIVQKKN